MSQKYIRPKVVAERYGISEHTLAQWRVNGDGPAFSKPSATIVLYEVAVLEQWLSSCVVSSTAEAARAAISNTDRQARLLS